MFLKSNCNGNGTLSLKWGNKVGWSTTSIKQRKLEKKFGNLKLLFHWLNGEVQRLPNCEICVEKKYILRLEFIKGDRRLSGDVKEVKLAPKPPVAPLLTARY